MSDAFVADFEDRRRQVRHYLAIVLAAERRTTIGGASKSHERRLLTLRAGTFLLLYNLIEATLRGAIEAIHDQITTERISFTALTIEIRKEVVRRFILEASPAKNHTMSDFPIEFVSIALDQGVKLSGNVDARLIRKLASVYGFSTVTTTTRTWNGADLVTIKDKRNALSHGFQSYEDIGRDYPARELLAITRRSLTYFGEILRNIAAYLDGQHYMESVISGGAGRDVAQNLPADGKTEAGRNGIADQSADQSKIDSAASGDKLEVHGE
jgi:HEPN superfamily protein